MHTPVNRHQEDTSDPQTIVVQVLEVSFFPLKLLGWRRLNAKKKIEGERNRGIKITQCDFTRIALDIMLRAHHQHMMGVTDKIASAITQRRRVEAIQVTPLGGKRHG
jgi:hypothetical protein